MHIVSYNVNGIRAALKKDLIGWLKANKSIDVFCVQETKAQFDQVDFSPFEDLGYNVYWEQAEKKGYSGVATFSKKKADKIVNGFGIKKFDDEGRILRTDYGDLTILNIYFPSGSASEERHTFKEKFLKEINPKIKKLREERKKMVVLGDYNVVHGDIDIHNPQRRDLPSGFRPWERKWMTRWFSQGFHDAFRIKHPEKQEFSWWSYRSGARRKNKGWRIDYISVSDPLKETIKDAGHYGDAVHSDHCPVWVKLRD